VMISTVNALVLLYKCSEYLDQMLPPPQEIIPKSIIQTGEISHLHVQFNPSKPKSHLYLTNIARIANRLRKAHTPLYTAHDNHHKTKPTHDAGKRI
jgi:hypothetical protein